MYGLFKSLEIEFLNKFKMDYFNKEYTKVYLAKLCIEKDNEIGKLKEEINDLRKIMNTGNNNEIICKSNISDDVLSTKKNTIKNNKYIDKSKFKKGELKNIYNCVEKIYNNELNKGIKIKNIVNNDKKRMKKIVDDYPIKILITENVILNNLPRLRKNIGECYYLIKSDVKVINDYIDYLIQKDDNDIDKKIYIDRINFIKKQYKDNNNIINECISEEKCSAYMGHIFQIISDADYKRFNLRYRRSYQLYNKYGDNLKFIKISFVTWLETMSENNWNLWLKLMDETIYEVIKIKNNININDFNYRPTLKIYLEK